MLSYFHGIRPNNRRSAIPQPIAPQQSTSPRYYHESPLSPPTSSFDLPPPRSSQSNSLNERSPISPVPPILPPIPRVTSNNDLRGDKEKEAVTHAEHAMSPGERKRLSHETAPLSRKATQSAAYRPAIEANQHPHRVSGGQLPIPLPNSPEQPSSTSSRRKRPIDLAYESMRSYSEPPRRQPSGTYPEPWQVISHPSKQPPLPPLPRPIQSPPRHQVQPQWHAPPPLPPPPVKGAQQISPLPTSNRHGKNKLNLLNPMSLLARRRSSQVVAEAHFQNQTTPTIPLADDYDPRIRGKLVHDFSAPRSGRNSATNETKLPVIEQRGKKGSSEPSHQRLPNAALPEDDSPSSTERDHTPLFKEHFDDSVEPYHENLDSPAKRRSSAFMYQVSIQSSQSDPDPSSLPAFARNLPTEISNDTHERRKTSSPPPMVPLQMVLETPSSNQTSATSSPPLSPPKTRSRATSTTDVSFQTPGSPRRFASNSSRFSFDLAGVGSSAQEQLLEEKHRQKAKRRERESVLSENEMDEEDDDANYDDTIDDDGLEERIPGVNADSDTEYESDVPAPLQIIENRNLASPNKSSFESATSAVSTGLTSPATPRDSQGPPGGFIMSKSSPNLGQLDVKEGQNIPKDVISRPRSTPGPITDPSPYAHPPLPQIPPAADLSRRPQSSNYEDDDLYFMDDEMMEDLDDREDQPFDESVFDDDTSRVYGLPLRDLKPLSKPQDVHETIEAYPAESQLTPQNTALHDDRNQTPSSPEALEDDDDAAVAEMRDSVTDLNRPARSSFSHTAGLTQDNLGLHDRLAFAANQAALDGKFNRTYSQASIQNSYQNNGPGAISPEDQVGQIPGETTAFGAGLESDNFAFADVEADDPIIAAANAEALENDDDGFYGQEFGFFARASNPSVAEEAYGGYFGPRALEGVHRSFSGRDDFLEPSLTPITERSEWSNRNSTISLAMHGYPLSAQFASNPQLADLMHLQGDEMSLEALRKLRRGAWGGSNNSLQSSSNSNSQNSGSPLTYVAPGMTAPLFMQASNSNQNLASSFHSFSSSNNGHASSNESDPSPSVDSPTITFSPSQPTLVVPTSMGPPPPPADTSPVGRIGKSVWAPGHSRTSSGAESVSYREEGGRWVCEKRRVDVGTGEVEVLGRTVVEGGRI